MTVDPRLFRSFVVLAEELHFGRAAERLHIAQPAVSQQLQRLEAQLGVQLVARTRHHAALTAAGEAVLPYAQQAVAAGEAARRAARETAAGQPATLRLGLSPGVHYLAERVLAEFGREHPGVRIRALADNTGVLAREIAAGRLEMAFGFAAAPTAGVHRETLCEHPAVAAVADGHPLAPRRELALRELAAETFALVDPDGGEGYNDAVRELCRQAGFEPKTAAEAFGPMAWESAIRDHGCIGLTTRVSAASTLRGVRVVALTDGLPFRLDLLRPALLEESAGPAQRLASVARRTVGRASPELHPVS